MRWGSRALTCLLLCVSGPGTAEAAPELSFDEREVLVSGVEPGGAVAWVAVERRLEDFATATVHRSERSVDDDRDGTVHLEVGEGVSPLGVWVAIDLEQGELTLAAPEGFAPPALPGLGDNALFQGVTASADHLLLPGRQLRAVVLRPGQGAWEVLAGDGGELDDDGRADGVVTLPVGRLRPVGGTGEPLDELVSGDLLVAIDPASLAAFAGELTVGDDGAAGVGR